MEGLCGAEGTAVRSYQAVTVIPVGGTRFFLLQKS